MKRKDLKKERLWAGETQLSLAQQVGLKEIEISRYETGRATPMPSVALKIAKALNIDNVSRIFPDIGIGGDTK